VEAQNWGEEEEEEEEEEEADRRGDR